MIHHGDCLSIMATMERDSIDSIVTDPPYGLSFMGKQWDHGVPGKDFWVEALRIAKPGAHLLAFGGTRTYHRLACAIEDAGWEVRDCLGWLYGSGFPKSLDVSKAIDKARRRDYVLAAVDLGLEIPGNSLHDWTKAEHAPGDKWWAEFKRVLTAEQWGEIERVVTQKATRPAEAGEVISWDRRGSHERERRDIPATDAARQWAGWGTALKPAWEPIILARKPLAGTVAENVQRHGTGALNIDGCRVQIDNAERSTIDSRSGAGFGTIQCEFAGREAGERFKSHSEGRWPANIAHDGSEEVLAVFPESKDGVAVNRNRSERRPSPAGYAPNRIDPADVGYGGGGSAARFFYCAKASKKDRCGNDNERCVDNNHPTVKPNALMRYLCRLITPPNGLILDPFTGSGSTGKAAIQEGFRFVGIELDKDYCEIARKRISGAADLFAA